MDLKIILRDVADRSQLHKYEAQWRVLANVEIILQVLKKAGYFLTTLTGCQFLKKCSALRTYICLLCRFIFICIYVFTEHVSESVALCTCI
jgi:hypothetical protein